MYYATYVRFVDEAALPPGHDFLATQDGDCLALFVRRDRVTERTFEEGCRALRALCGTPDTGAIPRQRDALGMYVHRHAG